MFTMDRARWLQLEPLLDEVLELSREEQGPWLEALQRGAPEDAADLRRLLLIEVVAEEEQFLQRTREPTLLASLAR